MGEASAEAVFEERFVSGHRFSGAVTWR